MEVDGKAPPGAMDSLFNVFSLPFKCSTCGGNHCEKLHYGNKSRLTSYPLRLSLIVTFFDDTPALRLVFFPFITKVAHQSRFLGR
jgi:hypothetical protein